MGRKILDRRIQRTRKLLQNALMELILEKGYAATTVQDIIDRANMGRSTFYAHFEDKENLLHSELEDMQEIFDQHLASQPVPVESPWEITLLMFQHAQIHYKFYKALVGEKGNNAVISHISDYLSIRIQEHVKSQVSKKKGIPPEILAHYLVGSFMVLLTWWLDHNMPYPPERMNAMFEQMMRYGVDPIIRPA